MLLCSLYRAVDKGDSVWGQDLMWTFSVVRNAPRRGAARPKDEGLRGFRGCHPRENFHDLHAKWCILVNSETKIHKISEQILSLL